MGTRVDTYKGEPYGAASVETESSQMATVRSVGENRWVVHMGSTDKSQVTVEVHMSLETAKRIAERETRRIASLNRNRDDLDPETVGSAVLSVLGQFAAGGNP